MATSEALAPQSALSHEAAHSAHNRGVLFTLRWSWQYRHLMRNLVARDLKVRYRGSILGFAWTFLNPLLMTVIFSVVLIDIFKAPDIGVSFPAFFLVGLLAWNFAVISIIGSMDSIVGNASIVSKVYFPRSILPIAVVIAAGVNFVLALIATLPVLYLLGARLGWSLLFLPVILVEQTVFLIGIALLLAVLNVLYRDTAPTVEVLLQAWFFLTPVMYDLGALSRSTSIDIVPMLIALNPMAAIITMYRAVVLYGLPPDGMMAFKTLVASLVVCGLGIVVFVKNSDRVGDDL